MSNPFSERQVTLLESFQQSLPDLPLVEPSSQAKAGPSSQQVENAECPKFWVRQHVGYWLSEADNILRRQDARERLARIWAPAREPNLKLRTEGDATHASRMYLLHPAIFGLALIASSVSARSEERDSSTPVNFGTKERNALCADVIWHADLNGDRPFAVMDMKRHDRFKSADLVAAQQLHNLRLSEDSLGAVPLRTLEDTYNKRIGPEDIDTWGEFLPFIKQAVAYASAYGVRYVALCSYKVLILVFFDDHEFDSRQTGSGPGAGSSSQAGQAGRTSSRRTRGAVNYAGQGGGSAANHFAGRWCRITILEDSRLFRKALLGFLTVAHHAG